MPFTDSTFLRWMEAQQSESIGGCEACGEEGESPVSVFEVNVAREGEDERWLVVCADCLRTAWLAHHFERLASAA